MDNKISLRYILSPDSPNWGAPAFNGLKLCNKNTVENSLRLYEQNRVLNRCSIPTCIILDVPVPKVSRTDKSRASSEKNSSFRVDGGGSSALEDLKITKIKMSFFTI